MWARQWELAMRRKSNLSCRGTFINWSGIPVWQVASQFVKMHVAQDLPCNTVNWDDTTLYHIARCNHGKLSAQSDHDFGDGLRNEQRCGKVQCVMSILHATCDIFSLQYSVLSVWLCKQRENSEPQRHAKNYLAGTYQLAYQYPSQIWSQHSKLLIDRNVRPLLIALKVIFPTFIWTTVFPSCDSEKSVVQSGTPTPEEDRDPGNWTF
jgi:hypothetical protein